MLRITFGIPDDHVVQQFDIEYLGGLAELTGDIDVGCARGRIAARVIVLCDEPSYVECMRSFHSGFALRVGWIAAHS